MTAKLLVDTLHQHAPLSLLDLRRIWHTGLLAPEQKLRCRDAEIEHQRQRWAVFQARQVQRWILEMFLRCFELALTVGCRSIEEMVAWTITTWEASPYRAAPATFEEQLFAEAGSVSTAQELGKASQVWNENVHGQHTAYEWLAQSTDHQEAIRACHMLARWYLRIYAWVGATNRCAFLKEGGADCISIVYLSEWIEAKKRLPFKTFLGELFLQLVFAQHLRVALARFDREMQ